MQREVSYEDYLKYERSLTPDKLKQMTILSPSTESLMKELSLDDIDHSDTNWVKVQNWEQSPCCANPEETRQWGLVYRCIGEIIKLKKTYSKEDWNNMSPEEFVSSIRLDTTEEHYEELILKLVSKMDKKGLIGRKMREYLYLTGQLKKQTQKVSENSI